MGEHLTIYRTVWSSSEQESGLTLYDLVNFFVYVFSVGYSHISPFLFTRTLLPVMEKTALEPESDVRIVNVRATLGGIRAALIDKTQVSSVAHRWVPNPRYDSLEAFNNDFTSTWRPKLNVYCKCLFYLAFQG